MKYLILFLCVISALLCGCSSDSPIPPQSKEPPTSKSTKVSLDKAMSRAQKVMEIIEGKV